MKNDSNSKVWLFVSIMILVACSIYLATATLLGHLAQVERRAVYEEHAEQAQALLDQQQRIVNSATDNYHTDAYDPGVERIAEQQLIAAEYQILLLQVIAQQNAQMIELMMVWP